MLICTTIQHLSGTIQIGEPHRQLCEYTNFTQKGVRQGIKPGTNHHATVPFKNCLLKWSHTDKLAKAKNIFNNNM